MPDINKPENAATSQPKAKRSETFIRIYANSANIEATAWDFNIIFGELKKSGNEMFIEQSVAITMSPQHAKALAGILFNNVKEYEKQVGEIKLPPQPSVLGSNSEPKSAATMGPKAQ